jgi:hypothetical protein
MPLKDLPPDARPREKLLARGPGALSDVELLAILLRTGIQGKGVLQMAKELLELKKTRMTQRALTALPACCTPPRTTSSASRASARPSVPRLWPCWSCRAGH